MTKRKFGDGDIVFVPKDDHHEVYKYCLMLNGEAYWRKLGITEDLNPENWPS